MSLTGLSQILASPIKVRKISCASVFFQLNQKTNAAVWSLPFISAIDFYTDELDADEDIQQLQKDIVYTVRLATCDANKYLEVFLCYDYIWLDDKHLRLKTFLKECERKCMDDDEDDCFDDVANGDGDGDRNDNPYTETDGVYDPNLQTEMFQDQVNEQLSYLCFKSRYTRNGGQRNFSWKYPARTPCDLQSIFIELDSNITCQLWKCCACTLDNFHFSFYSRLQTFKRLLYENPVSLFWIYFRLKNGWICMNILSDSIIIMWFRTGCWSINDHLSITS